MDSVNTEVMWIKFERVKMEIVRNLKVPTGNILIVEGDKGKLECLSIGDYGKDLNIKADFLGITKEIKGVPNSDIMPLEKKWVITISTQYGCSMKCKFCDVPKVGPGKNATISDLIGQVNTAISLHPEVKRTDRLNIHYARMGEPTFNGNVLVHAYSIKNVESCNPITGSLIHPVVSTMLPRRNKDLFLFLNIWTDVIKNSVYEGDAGLQFSINSTNDNQRKEMFSGNSLSLEEISSIGKLLPNPIGRKYALNIALADSYEVNAKEMKRLFSPEKFMVKITPLHVTNASSDNDIITSGGYTDYTPYESVEKELIAEGFDVLVFVPSIDEDESRITCGNAILSGTKPLCKYRSDVDKI